MVGWRFLMGIGVTILLAVAMIGATLALGPAVGDVRLPWQGSVQGDDPGVATAGAINASEQHRYVNTTFRFECWADWCRPESGPLVFRIQQANHSEFEWEGLYTAEFSDNDELNVALYRGQTYRLLVRHPDGRIFVVDEYTATEPDEVEVSLTVEDAW